MYVHTKDVKQLQVREGNDPTNLRKLVLINDR